MILIRFRRSLPAIVARTVFPTSSSMENIPALNFSTTLPISSIASSFGKSLLYGKQEQGVARFVPHPCRSTLLPAALARAAASAPIAAARAAFGLRASFVDVQRSAVDVFAVQAVDRGVTFGVGAHFDKCETPGLTGLTIGDNIHSVNGAVCLEHGTHGVLRGPETEVTYKNVFQSSFFLNLQSCEPAKSNRGGIFGPNDAGTYAIGRTDKDISILAQARQDRRNFFAGGRSEGGGPRSIVFIISTACYA
jgi:hypothetical protein